MKHEPTFVILRRARIEDGRKPRRVEPGDYFAVIVNSSANYGNVPAVTSYFGHSMAPTFGECSLEYFWESRPATVEECPKALINYLTDIEPVGPIVYRKRLTHEDRMKMWERE